MIISNIHKPHRSEEADIGRSSADRPVLLHKARLEKLTTYTQTFKNKAYALGHHTASFSDSKSDFSLFMKHWSYVVGFVRTERLCERLLRRYACDAGVVLLACMLGCGLQAPVLCTRTY